MGTTTSTTIFTSTITPTTSTPTSTVTVTPTPTCPACYHNGSYYAVNETWVDVSNCLNFTCIEVTNPCYPSNVSTQIEANTLICQKCPQGYQESYANHECCPECIPTPDIPEICKVVTFGEQLIVYQSMDHGTCTSDKQYMLTGCSGLCSSSSKAKLGKDVYTPSCKCCEPTSVQEYNITMTCGGYDQVQIYSTFHVIQECACHVTTCETSYNLDKVTVVEKSGIVKRSLLDSIGQMKDMDDSDSRRYRRSLLNDLAVVKAQAQKKKKK